MILPPLRQQIGSTPIINSNFWSFSITGKVDHPAIWSLADLQALPCQSFSAAVICSGMSEQAYTPLEAEWVGVPLLLLLNEIIIDPSANFARIHAADGYRTVLSRNALDGGFLVHSMDGAPLPPEHGFPARIILPGRYGHKQPKWVERIEFSASAAGDTWELSGLSKDGILTAAARLLRQTVDGSVLWLEGYAFAPYPIRDVWVSIDKGDWMPAQAEPPRADVARTNLVNWRIHWVPPYSGKFSVRLRVECERPSASDVIAAFAIVTT